jgi:hypothetical protein
MKRIRSKRGKVFFTVDDLPNKEEYDILFDIRFSDLNKGKKLNTCFSKLSKDELYEKLKDVRDKSRGAIDIASYCLWLKYLKEAKVR